MDVRLCVVPFDSAREGWRMGAGPGRLLEAGLAHRLAGGGNRVQTTVVRPSADPPPAEIRTAFELARLVAGEVRAARAAGALPIVLAGNCNTALGALAGLGAAGAPDHATGVLWFDAHGDFNTPETTTGGFLDGMALAAATGRCWTSLAATIPGFAPVPDERVALIGARDLDPGEQALVEASGVAWLPTDAARTRGEAALDALCERAGQLYLHVDLDVLDPAEGRANGYAVPGGLALDELLGWIDRAGRLRPIAAAALTAYDPSADVDGRAAAAIEVVAAIVAAAGAGR